MEVSCEKRPSVMMPYKVRGDSVRTRLVAEVHVQCARAPQGDVVAPPHRLAESGTLLPRDQERTIVCQRGCLFAPISGDSH